MLKHDWPILPETDDERYDAKGCMVPRDQTGLVEELADGSFEVGF